MDIIGKPLFFHPDFTSNQFTLLEEESRHCIASLRSGEGDFLFLTDGKGTLVQAKIIKANPKATVVEMVAIESKTKEKFIRRLVVSPPKTGERLDWLVEKAVEIGVDEIVYIETRYSERDRINKERLLKIAISAMKQSKQVYLPQVHDMIKWKQFVSSTITGYKYIAHIPECSQTVASLCEQLKNVNVEPATQSFELTILIGPEGDFSEEEVAQAIRMGFQPVSLGKNILRTETAVVYSLACMNAFH